MASRREEPLPEEPHHKKKKKHKEDRYPIPIVLPPRKIFHSHPLH